METDKPTLSDHISYADLQELLQMRQDLFLLDVRSSQEHQAEDKLGGYLIPLPELKDRLAELPKDKLIIAYCRAGMRSKAAVDILQEHGFAAKNLIGGVMAVD